jgi:membrane-bound serine protease (ClpP class)
MTVHVWSRLIAAALVAALPAAALAQAPEPAASSAPIVYLAEVDNAIHPVSAEYMIQTMDRADEAGAALVVFTLRTPGGLVDSTRDIITRMLASKTPVVIFVGPSGARAASAGFILTMAADVAAMAPGTHIGAAHPVQPGAPEPMDETMSQKAAEDVAAYVRTLASGRGRNVELAELAVNESRAFTEQEAINASPPLIEIIAADVGALLEQLDGRMVKRFDGTEVTLSTAGANVTTVEMTQRQRVLSAIANPNIAFMLLSLGVLGLTIELWSPGAILPGIVGGVSLLLAFFALQMLPVNYAGVLLILLGLLLLGLEIKVTSYGMLTVGGVVSLVLGSMILIDAPEPELRLSMQFVVPVIVGFTAIGVFLVRLALAAQRKRSVTGESGMIGTVADVVATIAPGQAGQVRVHSEIWRATASETIATGSRVRVTGIEGLTLIVQKL